MSPEAQRIAIAEARGWRVESGPVRGGYVLRDSKNCVVSSWWLTDSEAAQRPPSLFTRLSELPDYLNDLNAMHEAAKTLNAFQWELYREELAEVCTPLSQCRSKEQQFKFAMEATAAERAEAFLLTIGKWKSGK